MYEIMAVSRIPDFEKKQAKKLAKIDGRKKRVEKLNN